MTDNTDKLAEAMAQPHKVALYMCLEIRDSFAVMEVRYVDYDEHYSSLPEGQKRESSYTSYVRVSEPLDVTLTPIARDEVVQNAVAALSEKERQLYAELEKKLSEIREHKQQLLALTHQPSEPQAEEERTSVN